MLNLDTEIERVTAEITTADVLRIAFEVGLPVSSKEAASFLRDGSHAHSMWKHMVEAGRQYIAERLEAQQQGLWTAELPASADDYSQEFDA